jgi:cysteinyl-tRNA synthetase
MNVLSKFRD